MCPLFLWGISYERKAFLRERERGRRRERR
jgi:hypothetical protein